MSISQSSHTPKLNSLNPRCDLCVREIKHTHDDLPLFEHIDALIKSGKATKLIEALRYYHDKFYYDPEYPVLSDYEIIRDFVDLPFPMWAYTG